LPCWWLQLCQQALTADPFGTECHRRQPGRRRLLTVVISVNRPVIRDSAARMYSLQAGFSLFEQVAHCEASFNFSGEKSCHSHFGH
jgi:hypothetical protein